MHYDHSCNISHLILLSPPATSFTSSDLLSFLSLLSSPLFLHLNLLLLHVLSLHMYVCLVTASDLSDLVSVSFFLLLN